MFYMLAAQTTFSLEMLTSKSHEEEISGTSSPRSSRKIRSISRNPFGSIMWKALARLSLLRE